MGRASRKKPQRLPEKLRHIRSSLGLSQNGLIRHLGYEDEITQEYISGYERGQREPPLLILLGYARAANVSVEALIDDELDLPERLPSQAKSEGLKLSLTKYSKRKN